MKYKELIEHILKNADTYINVYKQKETLSDVEKGVLYGFLMNIDSIKNQLIIEDEKIDIDLDSIMDELKSLIGD